MKEKIDKCIEYLKQVSLKEPVKIRVEEIFGEHIVLSFEEAREYNWSQNRMMKKFTFKFEEVDSMEMYYTCDK